MAKIIDLEDFQRSRESLEAQARALHLFDIVAETDQNGRITYANDRFVQISKYPRSELIGKDHRIINSGYHSKEFFTEMWRTISSGKVWNGDIRNRAKDGSYYWVSTIITPIFDNQEIRGYLSIRRDITEKKRKEDELKELREERERHREEVAAFVSHELRSPLMSLRASADILRMLLEEKNIHDPQLENHILRMEAQISRMDLVSRDLLNTTIYKKRDFEIEAEPFFVNQFVESVVNRLRDSYDEHSRIELSTHYLPTDILVEWDRSRIDQAVTNLLQNAFKYLKKEGGKVLLGLNILDEPHEKKSIEIRIKDDGIGIPKAQLNRIFEIFARAQNAVRSGYKGYGLGLKIAKDIVEKHHGKILVQSEEGLGSEFKIQLPLQYSKN